MPRAKATDTSCAQTTAQFGLDLSDDALITFGAPAGPNAVSFQDSGYMAVTEVILGSNPLRLPNGDGLFLEYQSQGVQSFSASGAPTTATYTSLQHELIGYTGAATFTSNAQGMPTLTGAQNQVVLARGSLTSGSLAFNSSGGIAGEVDATFQVGGKTVGQLDLLAQHSAGNIGHTTTGGLTPTGGTIHATFVPIG